MNALEFQPLTKLTLGLCKTPTEYRKKLARKKGCEIACEAGPVIEKVFCSQETVEISLVAPFVFELGFEREQKHSRKYKRLSDIYVAALRLGLQLCPAEVGLALRLQFDFGADDGHGHGYNSDDWIWNPSDGYTVAMDPVGGKIFRLSSFRHGYGDNQWENDGVGVVDGSPNACLNLCNRIIFVGRKSR